MDEFTKAYIECALWTEQDELPADAVLAEETLARIIEDCALFQHAHAALLEIAYELYTHNPEWSHAAQAGHDFWLTRNRHGAGFWDRGLGAAGDALTAASHNFGECNLYCNLMNNSEALLNRIPRHSQTGAVLPNQNDWMTRHFDAVSKWAQSVTRVRPLPDVDYHKAEHERALVLMLQGWLAYADAHSRAFGGTEECTYCEGAGKYEGEGNLMRECRECNGAGNRTYGLIGQDGVLGPAWQEIGEAIRTLLNGEAGRLDCGTLDSILLDAMQANGLDTSQM